MKCINKIKKNLRSPKLFEWLKNFIIINIIIIYYFFLNLLLFLLLN